METENMNEELPSLERLAAQAGQDVPDFDDFAAEEPRQGDYIKNPEPSQADYAVAGMVVKFGEVVTGLVVKRKNPKAGRFEFSSDENEALIEATAAVVAAGGGEMPQWLMPYRPHINLLLVAGGIAVARVMQAAAEQEKEKGDGDAES